MTGAGTIHSTMTQASQYPHIEYLWFKIVISTIKFSPCTNPNVFQEKDFALAEITKNNKAAKSNDVEIVLDREDSEDECLQELSQSLSGLLKEADTQESIPSASTSTPSTSTNTLSTSTNIPPTSTSTPSFKRQVNFFRP
ncbi:hypothetical protein KQX54_014901 [Cotesia glomerata]|uniref:Uncharacterized protein n=1 Tax=Cotesia glomerata TaxID=32391 RepID=A0AAV7I112_COTGL|nr:hypothetical protein KQX54_014901 [Cotesia glomerata]